ncbi:MAG: DUF86 domain-containing protein [Halothiobacillaceae bacterium]
MSILRAIFAPQCAAQRDFEQVLIEKQPNMPWRYIAGMRNVLAHEYLGVDMLMVWETVQTQLDSLQHALNAILEHPQV